MAKFGVYRLRDGNGYLLDCQADLLRDLNTRFVVPLLPVDTAPKPAARLNPIFEIQGEQYMMVTQFAATVPSSELRTRSEEHTSELQSPMRISYAAFCLKKKN